MNRSPCQARLSRTQCGLRIRQQSLVLGPTESRRKHDAARPARVWEARRDHRANHDVLTSDAGEDWWDLDVVFTDSRPLRRPLKRAQEAQSAICTFR
jgi:hypothetical protein